MSRVAAIAFWLLVLLPPALLYLDHSIKLYRGDKPDYDKNDKNW